MHHPPRVHHLTDLSKTWCVITDNVSIQKYGLLSPTKIKCYNFKTICVVRTNEYNEWGRSFERSEIRIGLSYRRMSTAKWGRSFEPSGEIRIFVNARVYFGYAVVCYIFWQSDCLVAHWCKHRFARTFTLSRLFDNRLHQNSFSTESFFMELFSQNDHSWNNPLPITAKGSVLTQMPTADAGAVRSSAGQNR